MADRFEVRIAGYGGQGSILMSVILGEAAVLRAGKNAVQTQSYGPESRGGASKAEVVIGEGEIDYPKVTSPDVFVAMSQEAYDTYIGDVKPGGIVIVDTFYVKDFAKGNNVRPLPLTETAERKIGKTIVANMVALGALSYFIKDIVPMDAIKETMLKKVPGGTQEMNRKAFDEGYKLVAER